MFKGLDPAHNMARSTRIHRTGEKKHLAHSSLELATLRFYGARTYAESHDADVILECKT